MKLTTKSRYAVMAMADLAAQDADQGPVLLARLAANQGLSIAYLEQLFAKMARAGLVAGQRGPRGGYRLAKPLEQICIADIVFAVDEPTKATRCQLDSTRGCLPGGERCLTHDLWAAMTNQIDQFLAAITLADVVNRRVPQVVQAMRHHGVEGAVTNRAAAPIGMEGARA
jgi:Rrf2 family transcriptional regulator, iron-sulfur cluster assembly transcription factor